MILQASDTTICEKSVRQHIQEGGSMDSETDIICVDQREEIISKAFCKYGFPAVSVYDSFLYFTSMCTGFENSDRIQVSKTKDFVIFRGTQNATRNSFKKSRTSHGFRISARTIISNTGLKTGEVYRLYNVKGGGFAIKRHEPEYVSDKKGGRHEKTYHERQ